MSKREISGRNGRTGAIFSKWEPPVQNGKPGTYGSLTSASEAASGAEVFCKKGVLRNFTKFTEKHLC